MVRDMPSAQIQVRPRGVPASIQLTPGAQKLPVIQQSQWIDLQTCNSDAINKVINQIATATQPGPHRDDGLSERLKLCWRALTRCLWEEWLEDAEEMNLQAVMLIYPQESPGIIVSDNDGECRAASLIGMMNSLSQTPTQPGLGKTIWSATQMYINPPWSEIITATWRTFHALSSEIMGVEYQADDIAAQILDKAISAYAERMVKTLHTEEDSRQPKPSKQPGGSRQPRNMPDPDSLLSSVIQYKPIRIEKPSTDLDIYRPLEGIEFLESPNSLPGNMVMSYRQQSYERTARGGPGHAASHPDQAEWSLKPKHITIESDPGWALMNTCQTAWNGERMELEIQPMTQIELQLIVWYSKLLQNNSAAVMDPLQQLRET